MVRGVNGRSIIDAVVSVARGVVLCVFFRRQGVEELFVLGEIVSVIE